MRHFYPRPPRGGRQQITTHDGVTATFLSTPSTRRATSSRKKSGRESRIFLSTPSTRRATLTVSRSGLTLPISIHALHEEGDVRGFNGFGLEIISIHALHEEGDLYGWEPKDLENLFLSTPSTRRATVRAERFFRCKNISIHALHEEGDPSRGLSLSFPRFNFYPRPPRGGRPTVSTVVGSP